MTVRRSIRGEGSLPKAVPINVGTYIMLEHSGIRRSSEEAQPNEAHRVEWANSVPNIAELNEWCLSKAMIHSFLQVDGIKQARSRREIGSHTECGRANREISVYL